MIAEGAGSALVRARACRDAVKVKSKLAALSCVDEGQICVIII